MVYIPVDWLKNESNLNKVHDILSKLCVDIKTVDSYTEEMAIKELEKINETLIIAKLKEGAFIFGA